MSWSCGATFSLSLPPTLPYKWCKTISSTGPPGKAIWTTRANLLRPWKAKILVIPVGTVDLSLQREAVTQALAVLHSPAPCSEGSSPQAGLFSKHPKRLPVCSYLPPTFLLTSYLHSFSSVPRVEFVLCIRDWDTLVWTKGWQHCAPALWGLIVPTPSTRELRRGPVCTRDPHSHAVP